MPRLKADPVDIAFRAWAALDTEGKQRLADRIAGYQEAMGVVAAPAPKVRQRKAKEPAMGALAGTVSRGHASDGSER